MLYQLAVARERLGDREGALDAYHRAVALSPNPGGTWHFSGMDFTEKARLAIARLGESGACDVTPVGGWDRLGSS